MCKLNWEKSNYYNSLIDNDQKEGGQMGKQGRETLVCEKDNNRDGWMERSKRRT